MCNSSQSIHKVLQLVAIYQSACYCTITAYLSCNQATKPIQCLDNDSVSQSISGDAAYTWFSPLLMQPFGIYGVTIELCDNICGSCYSWPTQNKVNSTCRLPVHSGETCKQHLHTLRTTTCVVNFSNITITEKHFYSKWDLPMHWKPDPLHEHVTDFD